MPLPPPVSIALTDTVRTYWQRRAAQHTQDFYAGVPLAKFPEDLRVYEHLIWQQAPDTIIEIGTQSGGSALWFRDRLHLLRRYGRIRRDPLVITIDVAANDLDERVPRDGITFLNGDVRLPQIQNTARELAGDNVMVVEDSAHTYGTTLASLEAFAGLVPPGGFFVVEDGCVDIEEMRIRDDWPRGVLPAVDDWLRTDLGRAFRVRRDLELYGMSCHPGGFLQRT